MTGGNPGVGATSAEETGGAVTRDGGVSPEDQTQQGDAVEAALRWLATRGHEPFGFLQQAVNKPDSDSAVVLAPFVTATRSLPGGKPKTRALAAWGLIVDRIRAVGSVDSRRRNTLTAAFRLPRRQEIHIRWMSSLDSRFAQLKALPGVFGNPAPQTTAPMHKAWRAGLCEHLVPVLCERLSQLAVDGDAWLPYVEIGRTTERMVAKEAKHDEHADYRTPSPSAQPVFMDLFVTTVFMRRRSVYRRITERLLTARQDGVRSYTARALAGGGPEPNTPVRALWSCSVDPVLHSRPGEPVLTELRFPLVLRRGEKHYFSSEAIDEDLTEERLWVNVEVDHYGIAPGKLLAGRVPIGGLTIRIQFDEDWPPKICWWYTAERTRTARRTVHRGSAPP